MVEAARRPPHGGYPTPRYEEANMRRRLESTRLFAHPGAHVHHSTRMALLHAGNGRRWPRP